MFLVYTHETLNGGPQLSVEFLSRGSLSFLESLKAIKKHVKILNYIKEGKDRRNSLNSLIPIPPPQLTKADSP